MSLSNTSWFGNPKDVNENALTQIKSFLTIGNEIELKVLTDLTNALCIYEYGPKLSLMELENFISRLCEKIPKFKLKKEELFYQMFNAICFSDDSGFILKDVCIMVFQPPVCVLLQFGEIKTIKFIIHLENNSLYSLGSGAEPIPFIPETSEILYRKYETLKIKIADKIASEMLEKMTKFESYLTKGTAENNIKTKSNIDETLSDVAIQNHIMADLQKSYTKLNEERAITREQINKTYTIMLEDVDTIKPKSRNILLDYKQKMLSVEEQNKIKDPKE